MQPTLLCTHQSISQQWRMHLHRIQKHDSMQEKKALFSQNGSYMSPWLSLSWQRCVWWTAVPTARASVVCVSARKAGQDQNVSRGTVTHAASTTASAERASVTATRAGRVNTAPSVSHADTCMQHCTPTHTRQKGTNYRGNVLWTGLKGHLWSVNVSVLRAVSSRSWHSSAAAYLL